MRHGVAGIFVSNHGGRQLDGVVASVSAELINTPIHTDKSVRYDWHAGSVDIMSKTKESEWRQPFPAVLTVHSNWVLHSSWTDRRFIRGSQRGARLQRWGVSWWWNTKRNRRPQSSRPRSKSCLHRPACTLGSRLRCMLHYFPLLPVKSLQLICMPDIVHWFFILSQSFSMFRARQVSGKFWKFSKKNSV